MREQNTTQDRQAQLNELLQKKKGSIERRRRRAIARDDANVKWQTSFDSERLRKGSGLIEVGEVRPFVDCETLQEYLHTARMFAHAIRQTGTECPDVSVSETVNDFIFRVHKAWYASAPLGQIFHFVRLDDAEFDDDLGFRRATPVDWSRWKPLPGSEVNLTAEEIAALPMVGKPEPEWKKQGFDSWKDWNDHVTEETEKKKRREELEDSLRTQEEIDRDFKNRSGETKIPQLLYTAEITET
jgi:hypothetical protein